MKNTTNDCAWLHAVLESSRLITYPFSTDTLPDNAIYFLYENGEFNGHGNDPRIVRVGTHRDGNFKSRICEHFIPKGLTFDKYKPAPKDRSIFRKNIGRAIINKTRPEYLPIWEIDFMTSGNRSHSDKRDMNFEQEIEGKITDILRSQFSFRYIEIQDQKDRMGKDGLEGRLIGTLSHCSACCPSAQWLGRYSPKEAIKNSGLWLVQHLNEDGITENDKKVIQGAYNGQPDADRNISNKAASTVRTPTIASKIIRFIDDYLDKTGLDYLTPVQANALLYKVGILNDDNSRPGLPLRRLLRNGEIPNAFQSTGGKGGRWIIKHSQKYQGFSK